MSSQDPIVGKKLGDYTIMALLGRGGMARVYKGYDEALDRYAAVKVITSDFTATADEAEYKSRFQREARAIARLRHPHIVGVYQFGDLDGLYYMAMAFLDGSDLRVELKSYHEQNQRIAYTRIVNMAGEIANALDYAHQQGVIHRDIKPSNIMMTSTGAVLTDFGLALTTTEGTKGDTFGSAHYIAPEQAISSARAVPQSDLYSLGVVLYEAFTGQVPFDDPSVMSVALKHLNEPPPSPSLYNPELPKSIERVLLKVLNKEPKDRYTTGKELFEALTNAMSNNGDETVELEPVSVTPASAIKDANAGPSAMAAYLNSLTNEPAIESAPTPPVSISEIKPPPTTAIPTDSPQAISAPTLPPVQPAIPEKQAKNNKLWWGAAVLLALLAAIALIALLSGDSDKDQDDKDTLAAANQTQTAVAEILPTETATQQATATHTPQQASPTATQSASSTNTNLPPTPTETNTDAPSQVASATDAELVIVTSPTTEPSETATTKPSNTPRPTRTPRPTSTATITPSATSAESPEIRLRYTNQRVILENISEDEQDISPLVFQGDENGRFSAEAWRTGTSLRDSIDNFRSEGCVQLVTDGEAALMAPCRFYNFWLWRGNANAHFWLPLEGNSKFVVILDGQTLAECPLATSDEDETVCEFAIPQNE